ncbi:hypothetical protein JP09_007370 [Dehalogenimonas etheniformans]|uniref:DUF4160 domain-containing protein n=1 Tax=Dehalogenimonas etheniformans TaxID=1536648 RepID=A0A2P5P5J7_9CHLR|nr:hypothetical protein JP09_007370 [Dehalogenimonas etheniformans]
MIIAREGKYTFIIHTRELAYEPPHVHIKFDDDQVRIELNGGNFMETPPSGERSDICSAYAKHVITIRQQWDSIHKR